MHLSCKSREKAQTPNNTSHMLSSLEIHQKVTYTDICHKRAMNMYSYQKYVLCLQGDETQAKSLNTM